MCEELGEGLSRQRAQPVQRPWGRARFGLLEEQQGLCGRSRVSERETEEVRAGSGRGLARLGLFVTQREVRAQECYGQRRDGT